MRNCAALQGPMFGPIDGTHHIHRHKDKTHRIISVDAGKHRFKTQEKQGTVKTCLNILKAIYSKSKGQRHSKGTKLKAFPQTLEQDRDAFFHCFSTT